MSDERSTSENGDRQGIHELLASRRRFLEATGAAGLVAGVGGYVYARQPETTFEFGGEVSGWQGRAPSDIEGETNPTLALQAGTEYEVVWENVDGAPHDFTILDDDGNEITGTETMSEQGETRSLTFTASEEMAEYICTVHPSSMVGDIQIAGAEDGEAQEDGQMAGFVPEGPSVGVQQVADGPLVNPVGLHSIPGEEGRHAIVDQVGQIYVLDEEDGLQEEPIFDVGDNLPILEEARGDFDRPPGFDERGLLGLAFHPDFEENGLVYARYSSRDSVSDGDGLTGPGDRELPDDWDHVEVLSEFQATGIESDQEGGDMADGNTTDADGTETPTGGNETEDGNETTTGDDQATGAAGLQIDPDSERVLLEIPSPQFNHNSGDVAFGPDGYLYMGIGDGGGANDTGVGHGEDWYEDNEGGNAQNVEENLLGSVLRLDVDEEGEDRPYAIPDDNPLVETSGFDEIYAYGLRNPWRMSFNDGQLIAADVGQDLFEEVDVIENGGNYGWNVKEAFHCFDAANPTSPPEDCPDSEPDEDPYDGSEFVDPMLEYPHQYQNQAVGISITGGYVYQGDQLEDLDGQYVFGDWSASFIQPQGRVFVASPEEGVDMGDTEDGQADAAGNETDANETDVGGNETDLDGNETDVGGNVTDVGGNETEAGNETDTGGNETQTGDNETDADDEGGQPSPEEEVDIQSPDEQPWTWEEVVIEGGENQRLNRFVQSFGRDADGEVYVLASRTGRLEGEEGEVFRLVPSEEGESVEAPEIETPTPEPAEDADEAGNETAANETEVDGNETDMNETAANETDDDESEE